MGEQDAGEDQVSNSPAASSGYPSEHVTMTPSHTGTPRLEKRGKITDNMCNSMSAELEGWSIPLTNDIHDWENLKLKLFPETQGPEKPHPTDPPSASQEVIFDCHLPIMETNVASEIIGNRQEESANFCNRKDEPPSLSHSLNLTEMAEILDDDSSDPDEVASALDSALVTVNGYRVKPELAPLLRAVFLKHNDISFKSYIICSAFCFV
ncbi:hypothetical protein F0562_006357 [Nyssa sinensis]|uniref:Uncharacterized protein n=1 Tax=Nyssa sinensis TaxID=561372 RepID=A0A5J5AQ66_9ASTE|nr:hypothetical protein F0562_006357 [Nyssa sinensis]